MYVHNKYAHKNCSPHAYNIYCRLSTLPRRQPDSVQALFLSPASGVGKTHSPLLSCPRVMVASHSRMPSGGSDVGVDYADLTCAVCLDLTFDPIAWPAPCASPAAAAPPRF